MYTGETLHLVRFFFLSGPDADVAADEVDAESVAPAAEALRSTKYSGCVCVASEMRTEHASTTQVRVSGSAHTFFTVMPYSLRDCDRSSIVSTNR